VRFTQAGDTIPLHAGSVAGFELAKRMARRNRGTPTGQALDRLLGEIEADRVTLENVLAAVGVQPSFVKDRFRLDARKGLRATFIPSFFPKPPLLLWR